LFLAPLPRRYAELGTYPSPLLPTLLLGDLVKLLTFAGLGTV